MTPQKAAPEAASILLPSGNKLSYSEITTFQNCAAQHFYRYYLRLSSRSYDEIRHMVMGSGVHGGIEADYSDAPPPKADLAHAESTVFGAVEEEVKRLAGPWSRWGNPEQMEVDLFVAAHMLHNWRVMVRPHEAWTVTTPEWAFDVEIGGHRFIGFADQVAEMPPGQYSLNGKIRRRLPEGVYIGEVKTRGARFKKKLRNVVKNDLQTKIYMVAALRSGLDPVGTIRTVMKKPPEPLMDASKGVVKAKKAVRGYYADAIKNEEFDKVFLQEAVAIDVDPDAVDAEVSALVSDMQAFYVDPVGGLVAFEKPDPQGFPCGWCEFRPVCREGKPLYKDAQFTYKKRRDD